MHLCVVTNVKEMELGTNHSLPKREGRVLLQYRVWYIPSYLLSSSFPDLSPTVSVKYDAQYSLHLSFCDENVLRTRCRAELIEFVAVTSVNLLAGIWTNLLHPSLLFISLFRFPLFLCTHTYVLVRHGRLGLRGTDGRHTPNIDWPSRAAHAYWETRFAMHRTAR